MVDREEMHYGEDYKYIPATSRKSGSGVEITPDIYSYTNQIVNLIFVGEPEADNFVLIDAGMPESANEIISVAEDRFGRDSRPEAIILTHGHFDHVGSVVELVRHWNVPVYAHNLELPFLTGTKKYPDPDPRVKGMVAKMSPIFPNHPVDLGDHIHSIHEEGKVPHLPEFRWIHTPGHSPGHISLFRETDRLLIAGDAFVTVRQESLYRVVTQKKQISGPPKYLTPDWKRARESVVKLESLNPQTAVTGHGIPMSGEELSSGLEKLAYNFDEIALPEAKG